MMIRFLQTTPSDNPEFPFQAGHIIDVPRLTSEIRGWLKAEWVEVLKDVPELAVTRAAERAVTR